MIRKANWVSLFVLSLLFVFPVSVGAGVALIGNEGKMIKTEHEDFSLNSEVYIRTDYVTMGNVIDLNNKGNKDSFDYVALDYHFNFDLKYKDELKIHTRFERNAYFEYGMPVLGRREVPTSFGNVQSYQNSDFLPELEEFFVDSLIPQTGAHPLRFTIGLFPFWIGNGMAVGGYSENYGFTLYHPGERFTWNFHYNRPDWNNRRILGPEIEQDERLGRGFQDTVANFIALDATYVWQQPSRGEEEGVNPVWHLPGGSIQPYVSFLFDQTGVGKRNNQFAIQTDQDLLGTIGADLNLQWGKLSVGFEAAKNFGQAQAKGGGEDVVHKGYLFYWDAAYDAKEVHLTPRFSMVVASGNKTDGSEGGLIQGSANRAFSVYSPLNTNLSDTTYQAQFHGPALAAGKVYGLNYGVFRPGTFSDPYFMENIVLPNVGVDFTPTEKLTLSFDWWYLRALEEGVGSFGAETRKKLSRDLGHEFDWDVSYQLTSRVNLAMTFAYFLPGKYYREIRDDAGTNFSPLIRGDGDADNAFYGDLRLTLEI
jgi:hypothetical protein